MLERGNVLSPLQPLRCSRDKVRRWDECLHKAISARGCKARYGVHSNSPHKQGCSVDIFTRRSDPSQRLIVNIQDNIRLITISSGPHGLLSKREVSELVPEFVAQVDAFVLREELRYDIMHAHHYHAGEACLLMRQRRNWNIPIVLNYHSIGSLECPEDERLEIEKKIAQKVDIIVAATLQDRDDIICHCEGEPSKIRVIPCGVDLKTFYPRDKDAARAKCRLPPSPQPIGLFVGRIDAVKNIEGIFASTGLIKQLLKYAIFRGCFF